MKDQTGTVTGLGVKVFLDRRNCGCYGDQQLQGHRSGQRCPHPVSVDIQGPGILNIENITAIQDPVTIGQENDWYLDFSILNSGGSTVTVDLADHDSTAAVIPGGPICFLIS